MKIYNTLTKQNEELKPIYDNIVRMYCCGPTVYNYAHIGNLRTYIFEDVLKRTIEKFGYKVQHAMNVTDVGHLTSDADEGEDKMLVAAEREKKSVFEVARQYEDIFFEHTKSLNIKRPDIVCRASDNIEDMIKFVKELEDKGYAYFSNGNVYFDTSKFPQYGALSGQNREDLRHGARVDEDTSKRNPSDFVLWFTASKFKNQILQWDSPWGKGYPGWHIECSVMAIKYLGDRLDIHCGGIDHIPVHHENEKAQSEAYLGQKWCNNWVHAEFLQVKDGKMSKSTGQFLTLDTLIEKGYKPEHYRYLCLTSHYRKSLVFSYESLDSSATAYDRLVKNIAELKDKDNLVDAASSNQKRDEYLDKMNEAFYNDLGTAQVLALLWTLLKDDALNPNDKIKIIEDADKILGLRLLDEIVDVKANLIPDNIVQLAEDRKEAKNNKNWELADKLRKEVEEKGYKIKDLPNNEYEIGLA